MSAPSRINKENFRLLDLSSDEESEDLQLEIIPSRKKKITRRERSKSTTSHPQEPHVGTEVRCALRWAVRGTLLLWLIMLTWICAALYDQVTTMRMEVTKVSTSSNGVDDALQVCHSAVKDLRANATSLNSRLTSLQLEHDALVTQVEAAVKELAVISGQLSAAPKLADMPKSLAELQRTVATLGSQINGFDSAIASAKKQAATASAGVEDIRTLLHQVDARTNDTIANITSNMKLDEEIKSNLVNLNTTLLARVEAIDSRIQEISKPVSTAAPAPTAASSTAAAVQLSSNATSTAVLSPVPAKPSVLQ